MVIKVAIKSSVSKAVFCILGVVLLWTYGNSHAGNFCQDLEGGLSDARNVRIHAGARDWVLREMGKGRSLEDTKKEIEAFVWASENNFGPKIHAVDVNERWILMDYIAGELGTLSSPQGKREQIERLVARVKSLHHGPRARFPKGSCLCKMIADQIRDAEERGIPLPRRELMAAKRRFQLLSEKLSDGFHVPTHHDLSPRNVIFSGDRVTLIDWTCAGMDDPAFDLSFISVLWILDQSEDDLILETYYGKEGIGEVERTRFAAAKEMTKLLLFTANFPAYEPPEPDLAARQEREQTLQYLLWNDPNSLQFYLDLFVKGRLTEPDSIVSYSLSALREFLEVTTN